MAQRSIHVLRQPAATPSRWPPLLFLHGGYVDARCWLPHFLPYFASHGYDCHAADLPGHGRSEGRACLDRLGLDDYLADLTPVVEGLGSRPVVIGHSMGALLAERLLERSLAEAAVLLSPVPPNGTLESSLSLFLRHPGFISAVATMSSGVFDDDGMRLLRDIYFTPATQRDELLRLVRIVQPESARAIAEMAMLGWRWPLPRDDPRSPLAELCRAHPRLAAAQRHGCSDGGNGCRPDGHGIRVEDDAQAGGSGV